MSQPLLDDDTFRELMGDLFTLPPGVALYRIAQHPSTAPEVKLAVSTAILPLFGTQSAEDKWIIVIALYNILIQGLVAGVSLQNKAEWCRGWDAALEAISLDPDFWSAPVPGCKAMFFLLLAAAVEHLGTVPQQLWVDYDTWAARLQDFEPEERERVESVLLPLIDRHRPCVDRGV